MFTKNQLLVIKSGKFKNYYCNFIGMTLAGRAKVLLVAEDCYSIEDFENLQVV